MSLVNELKRVALRFSVSRGTTAAKQVRINLFFSYAKCRRLLKRRNWYFKCFLLNKKNIADALLFYFWFAVDAEWEKMGRIVAFHEREFNTKIVPQNKLTPEKVEDFRRQIQRLKTHLVMRRRTESSVLMIQEKLNKLFLDLVEAGSICGMGQIIVPSSMLMWPFSKNQKIKF